MKKMIRVLLAATLLLGMALAASAQDTVRVTVPFDFNVQGKAFTAGTYTVRRALERDLGILLLQEAQGKQSVAIPVNLDASARPGAALHFRQYGEAYYLSAVTTASGKYNLHPTKTERMLAAKSPSPDVTVGSN